MPSICLNMIVKNETANLPCCLGAVADHIDCWVIGDTGSTDGTQDFIRRFFAERNLPGELHSFQFENFEQARNEALARAYASSLAFDYLLLDDADMELVVEDPGFRARLQAPAYQLIQRAQSGLVYWNTRLVRRDAGARYQGVTHEFLAVPGETSQLHGLWYKDHANGANRVDKFERDIKLLTDALATETDPFVRTRYTFYLAQSFRDCGEKAKAIEAYLRRASLGYWDQEIFYSLFQAAQLKAELDADLDETIGLYLRASDAAPGRAEALHAASRFCRNAGRYQQGYDIAKRGLALTPPVDGLFVEPWIYEYGLLDEFAVNAYWIGRYQDCLQACQRLLRDGKIPANLHERITRNAEFAAKKLELQHGSASATPAARHAEPSGERLCIVDIGGAGGLQATWDPFADRITPIFFEPDPTAAAKLRASIGHYATAVVIEAGLANVAGTQSLNVTSAAGCTSLRRPNSELLGNYRIGPAFTVVKTVPVECTRYDELYRQGRVPAPDVINIDMQGFEHEVLQGFGGLLPGCLGIELEAHFYEVYHGQKLLHDLIRFLHDYGLVLRRLRPVPSFDGDLVAADAFFTMRREAWRDLDAPGKQKFALLETVWGLTEYSNA